jgi:uncharacterized membrane protein YqgA involved in biofilm formation
MFVGFGTLLNVLAILLGSALGKVLGDRIPTRSKELTTDVLGAITLIGAASALLSLWNQDLVGAVPRGTPILIILASLLVGGAIGSAIDIEAKLDRLGETLRRRLNRGSDTNFITGFVTASLIFVIGPLAILGSISDGMGTGIDQLILKSTLDLFAALAFAATLGWGVAFSALPVGVYQGIWTLIGFALGSILSNVQVEAMTATGGILLLGIALRLLSIKNIAIGNLLPALALAPIFAGIAQNFN